MRQPLSEQQAYRINRARLALKLHKLPSELDRAPLTDIADIVEVMRMDETLSDLDARRAQAKRGGRGRRR